MVGFIFALLPKRDGKILMEERKVKTVDEQTVIEMAREETALAFSRFDIAPYLETAEGFWDKPKRLGD